MTSTDALVQRVRAILVDEDADIILCDEAGDSLYAFLPGDTIRSFLTVGNVLALLALLDTRTAERDAITESFRVYGEHDEGCASWIAASRCDCGFEFVWYATFPADRAAIDAATPKETPQ